MWLEVCAEQMQLSLEGTAMKESLPASVFAFGSRSLRPRQCCDDAIYDVGCTPMFDLCLDVNKYGSMLLGSDVNSSLLVRVWKY